MDEALAAFDTAAVLLRGPEGCVTYPGDATWSWRGQRASTHGEAAFEARFEDGAWTDWTLLRLKHETLVDGAPPDRPLVRQFHFTLGRDPLSPSPSHPGLQSWGAAGSTGAAIRVRPEEASTVWAERGADGRLTARSERIVDDGFGDGASHVTSVVVTTDGTVEQVTFEGESFSPVKVSPRPERGPRLSFGHAVTFDGPHPRTDRVWTPAGFSEARFGAPQACAVEHVAVSDLVPGAVFADEVVTGDQGEALSSALALALRRERDVVLAHARADRRSGALQISLGAVLGVLAAIPAAPTEVRAFVGGQGVALVALGGAHLARGVRETRREERHAAQRADERGRP